MGYTEKGKQASVMFKRNAQGAILFVLFFSTFCSCGSLINIRLQLFRMSDCKELTIYIDLHFTESEFCFSLHQDVHIFAKHWFSTAVQQGFLGNNETLTTQWVLIGSPAFLITLNKENIRLLVLLLVVNCKLVLSLSSSSLRRWEYHPGDQYLRR